jgi:hypothetical protein
VRSSEKPPLSPTVQVVLWEARLTLVCNRVLRELSAWYQAQPKGLWTMDHSCFGGIPAVVRAETKGLNMITPCVETQAEFEASKCCAGAYMRSGAKRQMVPKNVPVRIK